MGRYLVRRLGHSVFIILALMALLFFAINVLGDPVSLLLSESGDLSPEIVEAIRDKHGLNRPLQVRFVDFYAKFLTGDFGRSLRFELPAREIVFDRLPNTAFLGLVTWTIGLVGVPIGIMAARRPRGPMDRGVNVLSFAVISIPEFWLALMLILIISVQFNLLPTSGFTGLGPSGWKFVVLPALALAPRIVARNAQITRSTMIEELGKQYVSTARAKGLAENMVMYSHVLKNAAIAIVTLMGDELAGYMNGATITETIFAWPGLGLLLIEAISGRDLPVVTACVFVIALMVMAINLAVDVIYTWLDPRVTYQ